MKAIMCEKYGGPEVLEAVELDMVFPKENEIKIRVYATSVAAGDRLIRSFDVPIKFWIPGRFMMGLTKPKRKILGFEFAGEVVEVGPKVKRFAIGDKVYGSDLKDFGSYAEYKCIDENASVYQMPDNLSYTEAAVVPIGGKTALHYLKKASVGHSTNILIYGASGSVGTYAVQIAKIMGARVTTVTSKKNMPVVKELGADKAMDYNNWQPDKLKDQFDVIFDTVNKLDLKTTFKMIKKGGYYINSAMTMPAFKMIMTKYTKKISYTVAESAEFTGKDLKELKQYIELGAIYPYIDKTYSIADIQKAHAYADTWRKVGNIAIRVNET